MSHLKTLFEALVVLGVRPFIGSREDQNLALFYFSQLSEREGEPWLVFLDAYDRAEYNQIHFPERLMSLRSAVDLVSFFRRFAAKHAGLNAAIAERPKRARLGDWVQAP